MKPLSLQVRPRLLALILAFLPIASTSAWAAPAGIYTISRISRPGGVADRYYQRLSGDGSIVQSEFPNLIWSYPDGPGELFPDGVSPLRSIWGASPDMSILLGQGTQEGWVVATRDGSRVTRLEPANPPIVYPTALSPNGRYAAGKASIVGSSGFQPEVGLWRVGESYQPLDRLPDFPAANVVSVNDEGVVYGHGFVEVPYQHPSQPFPGLQVGAAIRWQPDGTLERLAGTDDLGRGWRQQWIDAISPDGSSRVGGGVIEREAASGAGSEEVSVQAVFDDSGARWLLWDGRNPTSSRPYRLGISVDGSRVFGHVQEFRTTPVFGFVDVPRIYSPDGTSVDFEVFLQSMGLDTSNWQLGSIIDMSDDGKTFLAFGSEIGGNGYQVLIVIPEPGTAMLLGLGLVGLSRVRTRGPLAQSPS